MESIRKLIADGFLVTPQAYSFLEKNKEAERIVSEIRSLKRKPEIINLNCIQWLLRKKESERKLKIFRNYSDKDQGCEIQDFIQQFNHRYQVLKSLLLKRMQSNNILSIRRVARLKKREEVTLVAMITDLRTTRSGHLMLTLEDPTGTVPGIVLKTKKIIGKARELVFDEVVGIRGTSSGNRTVFIDQIFFPQIPVRKKDEIPKTEEEEYAIFIADTHVGSEKFLESKFNNFLKWIQGRSVNGEQKRIAEKTKYLFVVGDLIDGVGVYPGQEKELVIKDIYKQYEHFTQLIKQVPEEIELIICPGNHDGLRLAEPQPPIYQDFAPALYGLPNVRMVSNPAWIELKANPDPIKILMYHGGSYDYYISKVPSLRKSGYDHPDKVMEFLLKKRHLAPSHDTAKGAPVIAPTKSDFLLIDQVPDIFATAHIHKVSASDYHGVTCLCCSTWQGVTPYQVRVGHVPESCRAIAVNLNTRKFKIMRFN